jgi:replication factor C small subunit
MPGEERDIVWVEKYRPKSLAEMVGQENIVPVLRAYAEKRSMPHLLFAGPPGTGKTTAAIALTRDMFGEDWRSSFLELNASVTGDTPVLVRIGGRTQRNTFSDLASRYLTAAGPDRVSMRDLEVLSTDSAYQTRYLPVTALTRHQVSALVRIRFEGGVIRTSLNHSIITIDRRGRLVSVPASTIRPGDLLVSFKSQLSGQPVSLDLAPFAPDTHVVLGPKRTPSINPTVRTVLDRIPLDGDLAWTLGNYTAEGCATPTRTSGNVVFTHGYPQERATWERVQRTFERYGFHTHTHLTKSGFKFGPNGAPRYTSIQTTLSSVQWMRFFRDGFYRGALRKDAHTKAVPDWIYDAPIAERLAFLEGNAGDATGQWGKMLRYVSVSNRLLVDTAWLARISGIESSLKDGWKEVMVSWPSGGTYRKSELLPARPFVEFLESLSRPPSLNWRYSLRHTLYHGHATRTLKTTVSTVLDGLEISKLTPAEREGVRRWRSLASSDLYSLKVLRVDREECHEPVYDLTVPESQMFWGGPVPILLHNSDERGIDTVRTTIKSYARSAPIGGGFKILFLDEADNLTAEAQASLRRLMERYSAACRFVLSCNYSSRIIDPIQSRCAVFRFRIYTPDQIHEQLKRIASAEKREVSAEAYRAIIDASDGDLRRAINLLQLAATFRDKVDVAAIKDVVTAPLRDEVEMIFGTCLRGDFMAARDQLFRLFVERGASGEDILRSLHSYIVGDPGPPIDPAEKIQLIQYLADVDFRLAQGASDRIQLESVLARIAAVKPHTR